MSEERKFTGSDLSGLMDGNKKKGILAFNEEEETLSPIVFLRQLFSWLSWRILGFISYVLSFVIAIQRSLLNLRADMLQLFYWGRTGSFAIFLQSFLIFAIGVSLFVGLFGTGINVIIPNTVAQSVEVETVAAQGSEDLLVETGSLETVGPQERTRIEMETYTTRPADTLTHIAGKYELSVDSLRWANNLKAGEEIKTGQSLKIPPGTGIMYIVQSGESLENVSSKHNASPQAVAEANWLDSAASVKTGMELFIPNGTLPQPTQAPTVRRTTPQRSTGLTTVVSGTRFLGWPVAGGRGNISQCPNTWNKHIAMDIADNGRPMLVAAAAGTVTYAGYHPSGYAWVVEIDHGNGYSTLYAHMVSKSIVVSVGDGVSQGQVIGQMGQTGNAYGIHVHFEVSRGGSLKKSKRNLVPPPAYMTGSFCGY